MLQRRQLAPEVGQHGGVVETPELPGHDADPAGHPVEDEADLPAAQDRDDGVGHRPGPHAGQVEGGHLPPVRQLEADDLAGGDAELHQRPGEPLRQRGEPPVGHDVRLTLAAAAAAVGGTPPIPPGVGGAVGDDRHLAGRPAGVAGEGLPERHRSSGLMTGSRPMSTARR